MIRTWVEDCGDMVTMVMMMMMIEWSLDLTNLYITLSLICQTIFFAPAKVTCIEKKKLIQVNFVVANMFCKSLGPLLY